MRLLYLLFVVGVAAAYHDAHFWPNRSGIVHLFEWKWDDIADECERFLQHKGYGGVQVSPVQENVIIQPRPWWERYQPISYKLQTRSGSPQQFASMVRRCNAVGVRIYVDVVLNHMTADNAEAIGTGGSTANTASKDFPAVPYDKSHFHPTCAVSDYNNATNVRVCELVGLKDLDQSQPHVKDKIVEFLNELLAIGVAGFRVDAAKHMYPEHLQQIYSELDGVSWDATARPFLFQEVIDLGGEAIKKEEYTRLGAVTDFKYGAELSRVFLGNDKLAYLESWGPQWGLIANSSSSLVFIDNHDNQRGHGSAGEILTYKMSKPYKMAVAFMLAHPYGHARVMSSFDIRDRDHGPPANANQEILSPEINADDTCTNGWICEHRWRQIYAMIGFRNAAGNSKIENWWSNGDQQIAFSRGDKAFIVFTNGGDLRRVMECGLPNGSYCDIISGSIIDGMCSGKILHVSDGEVKVDLSAGEEDGMVAIHVNAKL